MNLLMIYQPNRPRDDCGELEGQTWEGQTPEQFETELTLDLHQPAFPASSGAPPAPPTEFAAAEKRRKLVEDRRRQQRFGVWTVDPSCSGTAPPKRYRHGATSVRRNQVLVWGGFPDSEIVGEVLNDLHVLTLTIEPDGPANVSSTDAPSDGRSSAALPWGRMKLQWSSPRTLGDPPRPLGSASLVSVGTRVYILFGCEGRVVENDNVERDTSVVAVLETTSFTYSHPTLRGPEPKPRCGATATAVLTHACDGDGADGQRAGARRRSETTAALLVLGGRDYLSSPVYGPGGGEFGGGDVMAQCCRHSLLHS